jgi:pyruvate dehydrogenase E2 component (dihydrolipoamide acetyltransferase)
MPDAVSDFMVPDLGEGLEEATIVAWEVAVGDCVELNQLICVVETAKAEVDIPSPYAGVVLELGGDAGQTLPVGDLLIRIDTSAGSGAPPPRPAVAATAEPEPEKRESTLVGTGFDESLDRSRRGRRNGVLTSGTPVAPAAPPQDPNRPLAKPPVRLLARQLGVELGPIAPGSGRGGIITRDDVHAAAEGGVAVPPPPATPAAPVAGRDVRVQGIRARIADKMVTSRSEIPDASCSVVADATRLLEVRRTLNEQAGHRGLEPVITPFSLLSRFVVQALQRTPMVNASWDNEGPTIRVHDAVHLGIGTATDRGLLVTVVHDAQDLAVHALSAEMARLARGAREGSLGPSELQGSTFTISNFGALGLDEGVPIINHPEAAILGVGSVKPRPHVVDGEVVARPTVSLTLAFDHRICDGAEAGRFLGDLARLVEVPETSLLLP